MKDFIFPTLSVVIVTKNNQRTLGRLIRDIEKQDYAKNKLEIIIIDGVSTDKTKEIVKSSSLKINFKVGEVPGDPEICKGEGLSLAKGEIVALIDSDNYIPHKSWFKKLIMPLVENKKIVGSYTWRFAYNRKDNFWNRYFSLIGSADPVGLYLKKADKLSYLSDDWTGTGELIKNESDFFLVKFNESNFPTLGSNGFFARRKTLLKGKSDPQHFFHIDTPYDLLKFGYNEYAVVRDEVIHDTAVTFIPYLKKRARYMQLHYQKRSRLRRYKVFDPSRKQDLIRLCIFIFLSITFIQPLLYALRGYLRIRDWAWFLHPVFCFSIMTTYVLSVLLRILVNPYNRRK